MDFGSTFALLAIVPSLRFDGTAICRTVNWKPLHQSVAQTKMERLE
jgi:hypothetical protein